MIKQLQYDKQNKTTSFQQTVIKYLLCVRQNPMVLKYESNFKNSPLDVDFNV